MIEVARTAGGTDQPAAMPLEATLPEPVSREELCTRATLRRVAAMLDLDPAPLEAAGELPRGWHFVLMGADTPRSALRSDGFPGLGVPMPALGLPRLMLGGRQVVFHADIPVGVPVERRSVLRSVRPKTTAAGPMAVVTLDHALHVGPAEAPALVETQTFLLLPATPAGQASSAATAPPASAAAGAVIDAAHRKTVVPDETLLFQYSALGFNSHRIHLDRQHAQQVEGFADLVVNGGLSTLLLTEFLRSELGVQPSRITVRHVAPLLCNRVMTLTADQVDGRWLLKAWDDQPRVAVEMEVDVR